MRRMPNRDMIIKIRQDNDDFISFSGLTTSHFELMASAVLVGENTTKKWRELLVGANKKHLVIWGEGIFKNKPSDHRFRDLFFADKAVYLKILISNFTEMTGDFLLSNIRYSALSEKELRFKFELQSAGEIIFSNN